MEQDISRKFRLDYTNHRGERAVRVVTPIRVWYGKTPWHADEQWLLEVLDHERGASRNYALGDIWNWTPVSVKNEEVQIEPGIYRHFKGQLYEVICLARDSETSLEMVVYRTLYGNFSTWVRSKGMFLEAVELNGAQVRRFEYIGPVA